MLTEARIVLSNPGSGVFVQQTAQALFEAGNATTFPYHFGRLAGPTLAVGG